MPAGPYDLVSAMFLQSPVELPRVEVLRRAAAELAPGGLLLVVGHAPPPPDSPHAHHHDLMPSAATVLEHLDLPWEVVKAEQVQRTGPQDANGHLEDSVVLLRRP